MTAKRKTHHASCHTATLRKIRIIKNKNNNKKTTNKNSNMETANNAINPNDVLCGRGGLSNSHNRHYRVLVGEYQKEYLNAKKKDKKKIAFKIFTSINDSGGRFLKRSADSLVWSEVTQKKAVEKTSQALREGLDVRHKTVRPEKLIDYNSTMMDVTNPRKRPKLVEGLVMDSPKRNGTIGVVGDVPDLIQDETPSAFTPFFTFGGVSEIECDNVHGI
ncbi:MAG: hypothetical protein ACI90V_005059 [Bacillariaceae sp.]